MEACGTCGRSEVSRHKRALRLAHCIHFRDSIRVYSFVARKTNLRRRVVTDGDKEGIEDVSKGPSEEIQRQYGVGK